MRIVLHVAGKDLDDVLIFNRLRADLKKLCASHQVIVVHNADAQFQSELQRLGLPDSSDHPSRETQSLYETTLVQLSKKLVARLSEELIPAIFISGKHLGLLVTDVSEDGHFPFTKIVSVSATVLEKQLENGLVPVIAPIGASKDGESQAIRAEHTAGKIASALVADLIIYLSEPVGYVENGKPVLSIHTSDIDPETEIGKMAAQAVQSVKEGTKRAFVTNLTGMEKLIFEGAEVGTEILP